MTDYTWNTLEDAVLAALQAQLGPRVKTLQSYQGDWQADLKEQAWRLPAVLVMLRQSRADQVTAGSYDVQVDFTIIVAARQLRGEAAGRRDAGGVYEILEGVRQALWHQDLDLTILPFSPVKEEPWLNTREFMVYAAHYRTGAVRDFGG
jgi:phage gp37-like protein